ncbi:hypothetical protein EII34_09695 [Arachnia propionica]|uniref:Photosystem I assembly protein Ycf4 n=1 Tax=Arachnia propionica TaxID=1750 RepID=A0A3P1T5C2_9ACTN|nr:hypothetical protein [Arachnia propionica]MDO5082870.1 hypothetical protein [Arachnia propionica]RRD04569.1 hypothetical protein EII34_09695 [Arachnia propionica]
MVERFDVQMRPRFWRAFPLALLWAFGVIVAVIALDSALPGGLPVSPGIIAVPLATGGLFGIMRANSALRIVTIGHGFLVLSDGRNHRELDRIPLQDLAQVRVYTKLNRRLEATDRMGRVRVALDPYGQTTVADDIANVLKRMLPHLENPAGMQLRRKERVLIFPQRPH